MSQGSLCCSTFREVKLNHPRIIPCTIVLVLSAKKRGMLTRLPVCLRFIMEKRMRSLGLYVLSYTARLLALTEREDFTSTGMTSVPFWMMIKLKKRGWLTHFWHIKQIFPYYSAISPLVSGRDRWQGTLENENLAPRYLKTWDRVGLFVNFKKMSPNTTMFLKY